MRRARAISIRPNRLIGAHDGLALGHKRLYDQINGLLRRL